MIPELEIRSETVGDVDFIAEVTVAAFKDIEFSSHTEQFIVADLRRANVLTISLVAELDTEIVGHIGFSPVTLSDGSSDWYGLGPVSVLPEHQRRGIGKSLIEEGLFQLRDLKARGCCLVGHPEYYRQFGFTNPPGLKFEGVPPEAFFAQSFDGTMPRGTVTFHDAFNADGQGSD